MDLLATLRDELDELSRSERRIAEALFADHDFSVNASIIELATRAEVSPPTVTRFCRRMGCASFSDFKVRLAQSAFVGRRYLEPIPEDAGAADVAQVVVSEAQSALHRIHAALDPAGLDRAAARIAAARSVLCFGSGGNSGMIAQEIQNRLFRLGLPATAQIDHQMQLMQAAAARDADVIVASSLSGNNTPLAHALDVARDYRVPSIVLTRPDSAVAAVAGQVIAIDLPEGADIHRPTSARFALLALVDILATLVAMKRQDRALETLRRIKHQVMAHRDPDDGEALGD